jgi:serine/threonine protein kinase
MKELEAALQVFKDAWESGQPEGVTEFCDRYPDISDALRERIDDFLYVSAGLDGLGQRARVVDQHSHPDEIGPYEVLDVLGEGGMGIVYLCAQRAFGERQVAVKLVKPGMDSRQVLQRFEAERQALAVMEHPSIAHVFDAGISDSGQPYFVMEYVDGSLLGITSRANGSVSSSDCSCFCRSAPACSTRIARVSCIEISSPPMSSSLNTKEKRCPRSSTLGSLERPKRQIPSGRC